MASTETLIEYLLDKGDIDSLIHVGGHHGEEIDFYSSYNLKKVIYFEPVKAFSEIISNKINKNTDIF